MSSFFHGFSNKEITLKKKNKKMAEAEAVNQCEFMLTLDNPSHNSKLSQHITNFYSEVVFRFDNSLWEVKLNQCEFML